MINVVVIDIKDEMCSEWEYHKKRVNKANCIITLHRTWKAFGKIPRRSGIWFTCHILKPFSDFGTKNLVKFVPNEHLLSKDTGRTAVVSVLEAKSVFRLVKHDVHWVILSLFAQWHNEQFHVLALTAISSSLIHCLFKYMKINILAK